MGSGKRTACARVSLRPRPGDEPWLIKFDGVGSANALDLKAKPFNRIEYTYALLARQLGIDMADVAYLEEADSGLFHFMTRRFDRGAIASTPRSICTAWRA